MNAAQDQSPEPYQIRECTNPTCRLRFPVQPGQLPTEHCPGCAAPTRLCLILSGNNGLNSSELVAPATYNPLPPNLPLAVLVDNVRSLFNVGSIFRSADGAGFVHIYLCGITPTPENPKLAKTALGAERVVPWSQFNNSLDCIKLLHEQGYSLWALEEDRQATSLFTIPLPAKPLVLIVGNEVTGVDPALRTACEQIVAIPMYGIKRSLNVATAFGVAAALLAHRRAALTD